MWLSNTVQQHQVTCSVNTSKTTHIHAIRHCRTNKYRWLCDNVQQNSDTCYLTLSANQYQWSPAKHYNCWIPFCSVHANNLSHCEPVISNWCPPPSNTVADIMKSNGIHQLVEGYLPHKFLEYDCHIAYEAVVITYQIYKLQDLIVFSVQITFCSTLFQ
jgi:hypothetical protein